MADVNIENQQKLLNLILTHRDLLDDFIENSLPIDVFSKDFRLLVHALMSAKENGVALTRSSLEDYASKIFKSKQDVAAQNILFNRISFIGADRNDYPMLKEKVFDSHLSKSSAEYIRDFVKNQDERGSRYAIKQIASNMADLALDATNAKKILYENVNVFSQEYLDRFMDIRTGKIEDDAFVSYGIEELDYATQTGLAAGTLTLFCGDVGGFKSTMMMNIAMNAWQAGKNVLFVPLEMSHGQIQNKMIARDTRIPFNSIVKPKDATDEQVEKIHNTLQKDWPALPGKLYILDSFEKRMRVSLLKREIERNIDIFKPDVVVVDYIANLTPDQNRAGRNDLEIGDMLKDLRHMGRQGVVHEDGFSIISGAQIGREALKRVRRGKGKGGDKLAFYSEDLRGSHEYSADADNIFVLFRDPQDPDSKLLAFAVKTRFGPGVFPDGQNKAILNVYPECGLITGSNLSYDKFDSGEIVAAAEDMNLDDLDFSITPTQSSPASVSNIVDDLW